MRKWKDCVTDGDKWRYHAEVYAWRRIRMGASVDERTSPVDPEGKWFNEDMIRQAAAAIQAERRRARTTTPEIEVMNERYARGEAWREGRLDAYDRVHHPERRRERMRIEALRRQAKETPEELPPTDPIHQAHAELGVRVTEAAA